MKNLLTVILLSIASVSCHCVDAASATPPIPTDFALPDSEDMGRAKFSWDVVNDPRVRGYAVHWGLASRQYDHHADAGMRTDFVIRAFEDGVRYYSAITAYGEGGMGGANESNWSDEISFTYDASDRVIFMEPDGVSLPGTSSITFDTPYSSNWWVWLRVSGGGTISGDIDAKTFSLAMPTELLPTLQWKMTGEPISMQIGTHVLRVTHPNTITIDRIVLLSTPDYTPVDSLPRTGPFLTALKKPQPIEVLPTQTAKFSVSLLSTKPLTINWFKNGQRINTLSRSVHRIPVVTDTDAGLYHVTATMAGDPAVTLQTDPVLLTVASKQVVLTIQQSPDGKTWTDMGVTSKTRMTAPTMLYRLNIQTTP